MSDGMAMMEGLALREVEAMERIASALERIADAMKADGAERAVEPERAGAQGQHLDEARGLAPDVIYLEELFSGEEWACSGGQDGVRLTLASTAEDRAHELWPGVQVVRMAALLAGQYGDGEGS